LENTLIDLGLSSLENPTRHTDGILSLHEIIKNDLAFSMPSMHGKIPFIKWQGVLNIIKHGMAFNLKSGLPLMKISCKSTSYRNVKCTIF
jgi:hypothetical protein